MTYIFTPKVALIAKVQFEFDARNRPRAPGMAADEVALRG
jgi:hypothetical protein